MAPALTAVWCCSVGTTWTLEVRELDPDTTLGTIVDRISSGVPITQPEPDTLARELLAARGLRLIGDATAALGTRSRRRSGYVCVDAELIAPVVDHTSTSSDTATWPGPDGLLPYPDPAARVDRGAPRACIRGDGDGELDLLTAPLPDESLGCWSSRHLSHPGSRSGCAGRLHRPDVRAAATCRQADNAHVGYLTAGFRGGPHNPDLDDSGTPWHHSVIAATPGSSDQKE
ncbi:MAG: hypothetical protein WCC38_04050 [Pseudonocardiaceae bacterium]